MRGQFMEYSKRNNLNRGYMRLEVWQRGMDLFEMSFSTGRSGVRFQAQVAVHRCGAISLGKHLGRLWSAKSPGIPAVSLHRQRFLGRSVHPRLWVTAHPSHGGQRLRGIRQAPLRSGKQTPAPDQFAGVPARNKPMAGLATQPIPKSTNPFIRIQI